MLSVFRSAHSGGGMARHDTLSLMANKEMAEALATAITAVATYLKQAGLAPEPGNTGAEISARAAFCPEPSFHQMIFPYGIGPHWA